MAMPLSAMGKMAWRNLWRNHRRTIIMLLAIATGVWAMIFATALMRGMVDNSIEDGIRALPGHVQVHHPKYRDDPSVINSFSQPDAATMAALDQPAVRAVGARLKVPAMITSERDSRGVILLGVDPAAEIALGFDPGDVVEGRFLEGPGDTGVVVGRKMLERLETRLGKRIVLMSQNPDNDVADRGFRIVGVYRANLPAAEEQYVYAGLATAQAMLGIGGLVSEVAINGTDYRQVDAVLAASREVFPQGLEVLPWREIDSYLGVMMGVMDGFVLVWMVVVFLALSFGLVNTLMMAVFERVREIGLMLALGMHPSAIVVLILMESLLLLALGLLAGNVLALVTIQPLQDGIDISAVAEGMEMMGVSSVLYPALRADDVWLANAVVITLGLATCLLPAWRAAQYHPVEAIAKT